MRCFWLIHATSGQMVTLEVASLDVSPGADSDCSDDGVGVYGGSTTSATLVNRLCGDHCSTCPLVVSPTDDSGVLVEFVSGVDAAAAPYTGFSLRYTIAESGACGAVGCACVHVRVVWRVCCGVLHKPCGSSRMW